MAKKPTIDDPYAPENVRKQFHKVKAEIEKIEAHTAPMRAERDELEAQIGELRKKQDKLAERFNSYEREHELYEKKRQLSTFVKLLGGKTGNPDGTMPEAAPAE